ncbi:CsbD-like [Microbacterium azadirachtae]|uniref:CsbD-like n=1 Tax=Microbacterium azadirachtae TaxID=582680 RepID=A0A1I6G274_9MICO|nr:CsbD family protein [Microbacterium azadirachtae]SFR36289.1 CsbD-like [Microbacterium azadirachtae]
MSAADHVKNTAEKMAGKAKEATGKVTGNEKLENEGKLDQAKADLKEAGEHLKDDAKKAGEHLKDATDR